MPGSIAIYSNAADALSFISARASAHFSAREEIGKLQRELGTHAEVVIESGNVTELLNRTAETTHADLLVVGRIPGRSHIGDNGDGYGIIRESRIPVLSV
jgi:nucleotide-binding universal stress UspA family protein